ncbi:preprotein translocase subunit YajC [Jatrophihabitans sp.]|uniref:preprotein translocase subunit YajC n=1 Tax=Jatrophihabitans sp. TaxID=1932789 RepID=UPI0030C754A3|nr:preprotein translocase subunit YajC [Jatrophihabitans sp.]
MSALPLIVIVVLLVAYIGYSLRNRRRLIAEEMVRTSRIDVGTEVMTTSGLYGTVVQLHDDGTVVLSIAPGVEVKWALAALRDADSLADTYRRGIAAPDNQPTGEELP